MKYRRFVSHKLLCCVRFECATLMPQLLIYSVRGCVGGVAAAAAVRTLFLAQLLTAVGLEPSDLELKVGDRVRLIATLNTPLGRIELG